MIATRFGVDRCLRYAFELCRRRKDKMQLTLVHKTNVLTYAANLWERAFHEMGPEYPDVTRDYNHIDAACMWFVKNPEYYDTVVVPNMFGDIITDIGAMGMLLSVTGEQNGLDNLARASQRVENAIRATTPKIQSMSAGRMGYSTTEVGDLVASAL